MTFFQHATRVGFLMALAAALLAWDLRHGEASAVDGLRSIRQARAIGEGDWRQGLVAEVDHPLHPLGIVAMHGIVGGSGPIAWQRAAVALSYACVVLLAIPAYLLTLEVFGQRSAWIGTMLLLAHPLLGQLVANVLSETTFLLVWTTGLWAAVRFLRGGRFAWLLATVALGVLAFLVRPEGILLPLALAGSLAILPFVPSARINWPRWRSALSLVVMGSLLLAGPYLILEGRLATRPAVARILGLEASAAPEAIERERPLPPGQTAMETYTLAAGRIARVIQGVVPPPLLLLAVVGLVAIPPGPSRTRTWVLLGSLLAVSGLGLIRLHATGGYAATRHGIIPGSLLLLAAGQGLVFAADRITIPGGWLHLGRGRYRPGPAVWTLIVVALILAPRMRSPIYAVPGPFNVYQDAAAWLLENAGPGEQVLDMTDWSLYFSERPGHRFAQFHEAPADPNLRWIVVRRPQMEGHRSYTRVIQDLVADRSPTAKLPAIPEPGQVQVLIYDRLAPDRVLAAGPRERR